MGWALRRNVLSDAYGAAGRVAVLALASLFSFDAAVAQDGCDNPSARCGGLLQSTCLVTLGAGSLAARPASCEGEFGSYRTCLSSVAEQCGAEPEEAGAALSGDLSLADVADPAVAQEVFGPDEGAWPPEIEEWRDAYRILESDGLADIEIQPRLGYFDSMDRYGVFFQEATYRAYFAPDEPNSAWLPQFPVLDLIASRLEKDVTIGDLTVEVAESAPDDCPYVEIQSVTDEYATLYLVNQSWSRVSRARLEYRIEPELLVAEPDPNYGGMAGRLVDSFDEAALVEELRKIDSFPETVEIGAKGGFEQFVAVDLSEAVNRTFPDVAWRGELWDVRTEEAEARFAEDNYRLTRFPEKAVIVGRLTTIAEGADCDEVVVYFRGLLSVSPPDGLGGGFIDYHMTAPLALETKRRGYQIRRRIGYRVDAADPTFRMLLPLSVERSSRHRFRLSFRGGGKTLWRSPWIDAHLIAPRSEIEARAAVNR